MDVDVAFALKVVELIYFVIIIRAVVRVGPHIELAPTVESQIQHLSDRHDMGQWARAFAPVSRFRLDLHPGKRILSLRMSG